MNSSKKEHVDKESIEDSKEFKELDTDIKKSFKTIIGVVIFIMLILVALWIYASVASEDTYTTPDGLESEYEYNGFSFSRNGNLWQTQLFKQTQLGNQQYDILVYFSPKELVDISIEDELYKDIYDSDTVIFALNESALVENESSARAAVAAIELGKIIGTRYNIMNKQTSSAIISPKTNETRETPVVTCSEASEETAILVFGVSNETSVQRADNGCIYIDGQTGNDIIRAADRFMFQIAGVMR